MAAVLFVVTIPTENEEIRMKAKNSENLTANSPLDEEIYLNKTTEKSLKAHVDPELEFQSEPYPHENCSQDILHAEIASGSDPDQFTTPYGTFYCNVDSQRNTYNIKRNSWREEEFSSSRKSNSSAEINQLNDLNIPLDSCMEIVMQGILKYFQIQQAFWTKNDNERMYQITFTTEFDEIYESILAKFHQWGIGNREGSSVLTVKCLTCINSSRKVDCNFDDENINKQNSTARKQGTWETFLNSVRSRLNVTQIVRDVRQDAAISLDFVILLISAAIVASFGLIENSTVFIASSMLISPLMGPIIAAIFGTVIKDPSLRLLGLRNEFCGILIAVAVGFVFGLLLYASDRINIMTNNLTEQMISMCELHSLIVGALIAVPTGAAAAIGILGRNTGSLVGVAISASILPPAVNSGLLWALALTCKWFKFNNLSYNAIVKANFYSNDNTTELAVMGCISMCLTISNVICIYIIGIIVFKIKEIAPSLSKSERQLWKNDIKLARDLNKSKSTVKSPVRNEFDALSSEDLNLLKTNCNMLGALNFYPNSNPSTPIFQRRKLFESNSRKYNTIVSRPVKQHHHRKASYKIFSETKNQSPRTKDADYSVPLSLSVNEKSLENPEKGRKCLVMPDFENYY